MNTITDKQLQKFVRDNWGKLPYDALNEALRKTGVSYSNHRFNQAFRNVARERGEVVDHELLEQSVKLATAVQRERDKNRISNKSFREASRINNALEECGNRIVSILEKYDLGKITVKHETNGDDAQGLIHLSDLHLNELVHTNVNRYDFEVAAKRLKLFAVRCIEFMKMKGVKSVVIANTGDVLNSDRRLDEYLAQSTNRMSAAMLAVYLLEQFIVDLNKQFNVTYIQVSGNESRVKEEPGFVDVVLTDNYDILIYNILKKMFRTAKGVTFQDGDVAERVISIMGKNILITHGEQISANNPTRDVQNIQGKYAAYNVSLDFVVFGHVHQAMVADGFARGSSLVGGNAYSDRGLQLSSRASQNIHVFYRSGGRDSLVIDLQDTHEIQGYDIKEELAHYNAKSEKKLHQQAIIHQIII
jgi:predicted phosphodiesterase